MLERIAVPEDLKKLTHAQLYAVCTDIRREIVETVACTGGHLASSLGAVEIITALHYCLNMPADDLLFDVGHQAYAHKLLSGRKSGFSSLRRRGGISGFPNCAESAYDVFTCGHASTAVSWAHGIAEAKKLAQDASKTVALIGDGSLTGGLCFEGFNNCGHSQSDVLVVLNHNEMSISQSVGALSTYLNKIISAPVYNRFRDNLEQFIKNRLPKGRMILRLADKFEKDLKGFFVPGMLFEELGFRYFGPLDGHNLDVLIPTVRNVLSLPGPRLLHVITKKGKGYEPAEHNPELFHGTGPFDAATGVARTAAAEGFSEAFGKAVCACAKENSRVVAVTAAMPAGTGLSTFAREYPKRFFDVGIAESHAVSFAAGLAKKGFRPVVALYSTFLQRAYDQVIHDVALQNSNVIFAIDRAGVVGEDGPTHHGLFDISYMHAVPHMTCMAPQDVDELQDMLEFALQTDGPVSIRYPRRQAFSLGMRDPVRMGMCQPLIEGKDVCVFALGTMVSTALACARSLRAQGISCAVVNARFIKPLDEAYISTQLIKYPYVVTLEDGCIAGGFGHAVGAILQREQFKGTCIARGFPDEFVPAATRDELFAMYKLDAAGISETIIHAVKGEAITPR